VTEDDIKRHFDVVAERMEKRFDLLAEAVQHLDSRIDRQTDALDRKLDEMTLEARGGFREIGARIDVSVAQLGDRLAALEQSHSALETRVARLEAALDQTS
jgi:prefoldin subunit 5